MKHFVERKLHETNKSLFYRNPTIPQHDWKLNLPPTAKLLNPHVANIESRWGVGLNSCFIIYIENKINKFLEFV